MSHMLATAAPTAFLLLPLHVLPTQQPKEIAEIIGTCQRAMEEARAVVRPSIMDRIAAHTWN